MSLVHIEQFEYEDWRLLPLDNIQHTKLGVIVGGHFRILVDGEVIYDNREDVGLNQSPAPTANLEAEG